MEPFGRPERVTWQGKGIRYRSIMNNTSARQSDDLPILTDPVSVLPRVIDIRLCEPETDTEGYDPYNNAPPAAPEREDGRTTGKYRIKQVRAA
jgi:hypothetical protein